MKNQNKKTLNKHILILTAFLIGVAFIGNAEVRATKDFKDTTITFNAPRHLPINEEKPYVIEESAIREVTAYNAGDIQQCSGNPCISANGENICEALSLGYKRCAANFVPFGTRLLVDHYGICIVTDRLNSRYKQRVDIAMRLDEKERALKFGLQRLNVKIIKKED